MSADTWSTYKSQKSYKLPGSHHLPALQPQKTRGRPPKPKPHPVWPAAALTDSPALLSAKRGPGRPKKIGVSPPGPRGRPPGTGRSKLPKRPGRPPKPKSVSAISSGLKRRPGRPPKAQSNVNVIPFFANLENWIFLLQCGLIYKLATEISSHFLEILTSD